MEEIIKIMQNQGVGAVIVILFVWDWLTNKKDIKTTLEQNEKCLQEISNSTKNTAKSLELLQESMKDQRDLLLNHDRKSDEIKGILERRKKNARL